MDMSWQSKHDPKMIKAILKMRNGDLQVVDETKNGPKN
jgi:hypothetical protein